MSKLRPITVAKKKEEAVFAGHFTLSFLRIVVSGLGSLMLFVSSVSLDGSLADVQFVPKVSIAQTPSFILPASRGRTESLP